MSISKMFLLGCLVPHFVSVVYFLANCSKIDHLGLWKDRFLCCPDFEWAENGLPRSVKPTRFSPGKNHSTFHCKLFDTSRSQLLTMYLFLVIIFFVLFAFCAFKVDLLKYHSLASSLESKLWSRQSVKPWYDSSTDLSLNRFQWLKKILWT